MKDAGHKITKMEIAFSVTSYLLAYFGAQLGTVCSQADYGLLSIIMFPAATLTATIENITKPWLMFAGGFLSIALMLAFFLTPIWIYHQLKSTDWKKKNGD